MTLSPRHNGKPIDRHAAADEIAFVSSLLPLRDKRHDGISQCFSIVVSLSLKAHVSPNVTFLKMTRAFFHAGLIGCSPPIPVPLAHGQGVHGHKAWPSPYRWGQMRPLPIFA